MKRFLLALALAAQAGCAESTEPTASLYSSYSLMSVDGKLLPVPWLEDGSTLVGTVLAFGTGNRPRAGADVDGLVRYITMIRRPDQSVEHSEMELNYSLREDELRINLCPSLALCIVSTELVGTVGEPTDPLVLTHYLAGAAGSVYRFVPTLPD